VGLQAHHKVDRLDPTRAAIEEIANEPQQRRAAGPVQTLVHQPHPAQQLGHLLVLPMNIADNVDRWGVVRAHGISFKPRRTLQACADAGVVSACHSIVSTNA
jgi:hypothetical protein